MLDGVAECSYCFEIQKLCDSALRASFGLCERAWSGGTGYPAVGWFRGSVLRISEIGAGLPMW